MKKIKLGLTIGEWNLCVFPLCIVFGDAISKDNVLGEAISIGFLKWAITIYIWRTYEQKP